MQILISTTGTEANVIINDLGAILFQHPVTDVPLIAPEGNFSVEAINESLEEGDLGAKVTAGEITLSDDTGNPITPGSDLLDFVDRTSDQTIGGLKTFTEDVITIDSPNASTNLEMGYFPSVIPNCYGVRTTGTGFYYCIGANALNPQIVFGSPDPGGTAFFDTDAARPLFLNVLNTGTGLGTDGRGEVVIGRAGLEVGSLNAGLAPNLRLTTIEGSDDWNIYTGSPGNFDGWFRISRVDSSDQNDFVITNSGSTRVLNGAAGSPGLGFINASNYGMFLFPTNDALGLATAGFTRLQIASNGLLTVGNTPNYETLIGTNENAIPNVKFLNERLLDIPEDKLDPTGYPFRTDSTIAFNEVTREFTISPVATEFVYWLVGERHEITVTKSIILPNVTDYYFIYFDDNEDLQFQTQFTPDILNSKVITAFIYWNATEQQAVLFSDERHGMGMSWNTHFYLHNAIGMRYFQGFEITLGNDSFALTDGVVADEDITINIINDPTPSGLFEQILTPVANCPIVYKTGTSGTTARWVRVPPSAEFVFRQGGLPQYNEVSGSDFLVSDVELDDYFVYWIFASNAVLDPIYSVMGSVSDPDLNTVRAENIYKNIDFLDFPSPEVKALYRVICQRDDAEPLNFKIIETLDLRSEIDRTLLADEANIDHGVLNGLDDDDHPQYLNEARGDARYYTESEIDGFFDVLNFVDLNDVNIPSPIDGGVVLYSGGAFTQTQTLILDEDGCSIQTIDDTGLDWCNFQVGSAGSAFTILKKANGTIASPLPLLSGDKIGGWGFVPVDGVTTDPGYVSAEIAAFCTEDQDGSSGGTEIRFLTTANTTKSEQIVMRMLNSGVLTVQDQTDYETKIIGLDDAIPNVKYVDDKLIQGDLATVSVRRTTSLNPIPTTWTDFDWDTTDEQNNTAVLEYTGTPADEIEIKEAGLYWVEWAISADDECDVRLALGGVVVAGSFHSTGDKGDANQILTGNEKGRAYTLGTGLLTLQIQATTTAEFTIADSATLCVWRMTGPKGDTGAPGPQGPPGTAGGTVIVQESGVGSTSFDTINFDGADFDVTPSGSTATITANFPTVPIPYGAIRVESTGADQSANYNVITPEIALVLTGTVTNFGAGATYFTNSSGSITCNFDGVVEVTYSVPHFGNPGTRLSLKSVIQLNGSNYGAVEYSYIRNGSNHRRDTNSGAETISVTNGDVIRIGMRRAEESTTGNPITIEPLTTIIVKRVA